MPGVSLEALLELMASRRSVRHFRPDPLPADVETALQQAMLSAPSAGNVQPWWFLRVRTPELRQALARAALNQSFLAEAPLVVVACADLALARESYGGRGVELYALQDTAAAVQSLLLAAHAAGLGACWIGAFAEREGSRLLGIGPDVRPVALVPVGSPAEWPVSPGRRPVEEVSNVR
jgi:nitroreductase